MDETKEIDRLNLLHTTKGLISIELCSWPKQFSMVLLRWQSLRFNRIKNLGAIEKMDYILTLGTLDEI